MGWDTRLIDRGNELKRRMAGARLLFTIVEDGSPQPVSEAMKQKVSTGLADVSWLSHVTNKGKGAALRTGVEARGNAPVLFTDVDVPYTVESMVAACEALLSGADVVLGQRRTNYYDRVPWARVVISKTFRWVLRNIMRFPISDTQCGLKGFDVKGRTLFLATTIDRFLFDMEFVMLVSRAKDLRVATIDAQLDEGVRFSRMDYRILLRESFNFFKVIFRGFRGR